MVELPLRRRADDGGSDSDAHSSTSSFFNPNRSFLVHHPQRDYRRQLWSVSDDDDGGGGGGGDAGRWQRDRVDDCAHGVDGRVHSGVDDSGFDDDDNSDGGCDGQASSHRAIVGTPCTVSRCTQTVVRHLSPSTSGL